MSTEFDTAIPAEDFKNGRRKRAALDNGERGGTRPYQDKLPPHSVEAEQGVLGCILLEPAEALQECQERFASSEVFYDLRHRQIYEAMVRLEGRFDVIVLQQHLKDRGELEQVGGIAFLAELPNATPSAANVTHYIEIVFEKFLLRQMSSVCTQGVQAIYDPTRGGALADVPTAADVIEAIERDVLAVSEAHTPNRALSMKEALRLVVPRLEEHHRGHKLMSGLPTGFNYIDSTLCGLNEAEITLIGGRPGTGKTALVLGMGMNIAAAGTPVAVFSLEMTTEALGMRMAFMEARASLHKFRNGFALERDIVNLTRATVDLAKLPFYIDDTASLTIQQLAAKARRLHRQQGVKLFIVDYLQLVRPTRRFNNREQEVAEVSSGILALAKDLRVPFLVCVQLNREGAKLNRAPELTDFRDSGQIEQDAHVAGILWNPNLGKDADDLEEDALTQKMLQRAQWLQKDEPWHKQVDAVKLRICKNRNGPTGDCELTYYKQFTRFADLNRPTGINLPAKGDTN